MNGSVVRIVVSINPWRQRMKYPDLPRWRTTNEDLNEESENPITTEDN